MTWFGTIILAMGPSALFLDFLLTHQVLHFTAFGQTWIQNMGRGCVQGGCHSPLLFSRVVANATRRLRDMWIATGEEPPFFAGDYGFWALWFVDDGILCFRNMQQLERLFPRLQQSLAHLGLQINMSKSKLLGWSLPAMLPTCVDGIQVVQQTVFLGVPVSISYDDSSAVQNLLQRSVQAFFSNRRESTVSISLRMRMFDAVVTSTIRWALGTLLPSVSTLNALRVQCTTLLVWTLRLRQHPSWVDVQQHPTTTYDSPHCESLGQVLVGVSLGCPFAPATLEFGWSHGSVLFNYVCCFRPTSTSPQRCKKSWSASLPYRS